MGPMPASLQVLQTPELLALIVKELDRRTLAAMARTAGLFYYGSIHRLWAKVDAAYFLRLLPQCLLRASGSRPDAAVIFPPEEYAWSRFRLYSVHVTSLKIRPEEFSSKFFNFFKNRNEEFFPLLKKVSTIHRSFHMVEFWCTAWLTLVGPALRTAKITPIHHVDPTPLMHMLQELLIRCPRLEKLSLPSCKWMVEDDRARRTSIGSIRSTLSSLPHLVSLIWEGEHIPSEVLQTIAMHPGLKRVQLQCPPAGLLAGSKTWFPASRRLRLSGCPPHAINDWFSGLASTELLEDVWLEFDDTTFADEDGINLVDEVTPIPLLFFRPMAQFTSLAIIRIDFYFYYGWIRMFSWKSFEPLLSCRGVTSFSLGLPHVTWMDFDDDAIGKLGRAWRELEILILTPTWSDDTSHQLVTLHGLGQLASYCPKLREVILTISIHDNELITGGTPDGAKTNIRTTSGTLEYLDLHYTKFPEPTRDTFDGAHYTPCHVAKILRGYWPTLNPEGFWRYWDVMELPGAEEPEHDVRCQMEWLRGIRECMKELDTHDQRSEPH